MTSFEEADKDCNGAIEKAEWDTLLLDDKRRRIEDEDAHRDQVLCSQVQSALTKLHQLLAAWPAFTLCLLLVLYLSLWV